MATGLKVSFSRDHWRTTRSKTASFSPARSTAHRCGTPILESCKFDDEITLAGTSFRYADLSHATFHQCDLTNSDLSQSKWYDVTISATKAVGLNARGVSNARHINDNTTLHASLISDSQLSFADLSHSDLKASHFTILAA